MLNEREAWGKTLHWWNNSNFIAGYSRELCLMYKSTACYGLCDFIDKLRYQGEITELTLCLMKKLIHQLPEWCPGFYVWPRTTAGHAMRINFIKSVLYDLPK